MKCDSWLEGCEYKQLIKTMNDKLQTIQETIDKIKEILCLQGEDVPFEDIPCFLEDVITEKYGILNGYSPVMAFSTIKDTPPTANVMDHKTGLVEGLEDEGWSQSITNIAMNKSADRQLYVSNAIFDGFGTMIQGWSNPVNIIGVKGADGINGTNGVDGADGADGADGMDGSVYEYVYFRGLIEDDKPSTPKSINQDDYRPTETQVSKKDSSIVLSWSDRAQGVNSLYTCEWQSERKRDLNSGNWGPFSEPILWAKYGEKGKDGDGVQYIFTLTNSATPPPNPTPKYFETDSEYQNGETNEYIPKKWSDDPGVVDENTPYCWMCIRRYRNGMWGAYTDPILWDNFYKDGIPSDAIIVELSPDMMMVNPKGSAATTVTAHKGGKAIDIESVTCTFEGGTANYTTEQDLKDWDVIFTDIEFESAYVFAKLTVVVEGGIERTKTFGMYSTAYDQDTVVVNWSDDHILIPCSNGVTPDEKFFPRTIEAEMWVGGEKRTITNITSEYTTFNKSDQSIQLTGVPDENSGSIKLTVTDGTNTVTEYINYTKFDTKGGTVSMYWLNIPTVSILCDTKSGRNQYMTYPGSSVEKKIYNTKVYVQVNQYGSEEKVLNLDELPKGWKVYYANDPSDYGDDGDTTEEWEEVKKNDEGKYYVELGEDTNPDVCLVFQLRQGDKTWDTESIDVSIDRVPSAYRLICDPNQLFMDPDNKFNQSVSLFLTRDVADEKGLVIPESLNEVPGGYDLMYSIDGGSWKHVDGPNETAQMPRNVEIGAINSMVTFALIVDKFNEEDNRVVCTETVMATSAQPGKDANICSLTDPYGTLSCDADGKVTKEQTCETTVYVTNATISDAEHVDIDSNIQSDAFLYKRERNENGSVTITFYDFDNLPEVTHVKIEASYTNNNGDINKGTCVYTIVKLKVADATTTLDIYNQNIYIPVDERNTSTIPEISTGFSLTYGSKDLKVNKVTAKGGEVSHNGSVLTIDTEGMTFTGDSPNRITVTVEYIDDEGNKKTKSGDIFLYPDAGNGDTYDLCVEGILKYDDEKNEFADNIRGYVLKNGQKRCSFQDLQDAYFEIWYKGVDEEGWLNKALTTNDFDEENSFIINVNERDGDKAYLDLDTAAVVALMKDNEVLQTETISALYDGRDFTKYELVLSDYFVQKTTTDDGITFSPDKIYVKGIIEKAGTINKIVPANPGDKVQYHDKSIKGFDIYYEYGIRYDFDENFNTAGLKQLVDSNGTVDDDPIPLDNTRNALTVYLVGIKDDGTKVLSDYKEVEFIPIDERTSDIKVIPLIYPAGDWKEGVTYTGTSDRAPYVFYDGDENYKGHYIACGTPTGAPGDSNIIWSDQEVDWRDYETINEWVEMANFEAIYSNIGVIKTALVGKWVFYKDWMFSQEGVAADGTLTDYSKIDEWNEDWQEKFTPNILFNAKTGEGHFGAGKVKLGSNTNITSVGGWEVTDDGLVVRNDNNSEIAKLGNDGSGFLGSFVDTGKSYKAFSWDGENEAKIGNSIHITPDGFIASDNLDDPQSYFKLGKVTFDDNTTSEYIMFKAANDSGFRTSSCDGFGLAVYGPGAFNDTYCHNSALLVVNGGNSEYGLSVSGDVLLKGDVLITPELNSLPITLTVEGDISCDNLLQDSDERLKNFSTDISVDLDELAKLRKQYFTWKDSKDSSQYIGVSAQEIQKLYPEIVKEKEDGYLSVAYDKLSVIALKAIDVLHQDNLKLKAEIEELKKLVAQ